MSCLYWPLPGSVRFPHLKSIYPTENVMVEWEEKYVSRPCENMVSEQDGLAYSEKHWTKKLLPYHCKLLNMFLASVRHT